MPFWRHSSSVRMSVDVCRGRSQSVSFLQEHWCGSGDIPFLLLPAVYSAFVKPSGSQERINRILALAHLMSSNYLNRSLHAVAQICLFLLNVSFPVTLLTEKAKATSSHKLFSVEESSTEPVPNTYRKTNTRVTYRNPKRRCIYRFLCVIGILQPNHHEIN